MKSVRRQRPLVIEQVGTALHQITRYQVGVGLITVAIGLSIVWTAMFVYLTQQPLTTELITCSADQASPPTSSETAKVDQLLTEAAQTESAALEKLEAYQQSGGLTKGRVAKQLKQHLEERKQAWLTLARTDPPAASRIVLTGAAASTFNEVSQNCVEIPSTIKGRVEILHKHADPVTAVNEFTLQTDAGEKRLYVSPADQPTIEAAGVVKVTGFSFPNDDEFFAYYAPTGGPPAGPVEVLQPDVAASTSGTEKLLILLGDYQNTNVVLPTVNEAERVAEYSKQYFLENSFGKLTLEYHASGIHEMAIDRGNNCPFLTVAGALVAAADPVIDYSQYDHQHLAIFAPFKNWYTGETTDPSCHWAAIATTYDVTFNTNEGPVHMTVAGYRSPMSEPMGNGVLHHELSHNIAGAGHGNWADCPAGVTFYNGTTCKSYEGGNWNQELEYRDVYDALGGWIDRPPYAFEQGHFGAPRKEWVGWFDASNVATVLNGGSAQRFILEPIERPGPGLKTVKIERGTNDYLFVEYRQPNFAGGQQNLDGLMFSTELPNVFQGALFHLQSGTATELLDATPNPANDNGSPTLPVGQTLTDPATGATVTVVSQTPDALTIDVTPPHIDYVQPPPPAYVNDGPGNDEDITASTSSLSANWPAVVDPGSGLDRYEYAIGTIVDATSLVNFTSIGTATSVTVNNLSLTPGQTYYVSVRPADQFGNVGYAAMSDGVLVTGTQPSPAPSLPIGSTPRPPGLVVDGVDFNADLDLTGKTTVLTGAWSASPDRNTNVSKYQYAIGTTPAGTDVVGFTDIGIKFQTTHYGLDLQPNQTYYFSVRAVSLNGTTAGPTRSSNGITVDTTPPPVPSFVNDGLAADEDVTPSLTTLKANWEDVTDTSGVSYQYAIGTTPGLADIVSYSTAGGANMIQGGMLLENNQRYYISVRAVDGLGNIGSSIISDGILTNASLDTQPPSVAIVSPSGSALVFGNVTITADASDDYNVEGVQFRLNGVNFDAEDITAPFQTSWDTTFTTPGAYILTAVARDTAGRKTISAPVVVNVIETPDTSPPTVTITYPLNGAVISNGTIPFSGVTSDNVGVVGTQRQIDGVNFGPETTTESFSSPWNTTTVCNGYHALTATSRDGANNIGTATVTVRVANDPTGQPGGCDTTPLPPPGSVSDGVAADIDYTTNLTSLSANWTAVSDPQLLKYQYAIGTTAGGSDVVPFTDTTAINITRTGLSLADGQAYYVSVRTVDAASNTGSAQSSDGLTVDTTNPHVSITQPLTAATVSSTVTVTATATDTVSLAGVQFQLDAVNLGLEDTSPPYSVSWDTTLTANGPVTLTAIARDGAGNTATSIPIPVTILNDLALPSVSLLSPLPAATVAGDVTISANAADDIAVAEVEFRVDGLNVGQDNTPPYLMSWDSTTVPNGPHTLTAVATDTSGKTKTSSPVTITVRNDRTPPTVSITSPVNAAIVSDVITVQATASDDVAVAGVQFQLNQAQLGPEDTTAPYSVQWDTALTANGPATITAIARDTADRTTTAPDVTVAVNNILPPPPDTTAPQVSFAEPTVTTIDQGTPVRFSVAAMDTGLNLITLHDPTGATLASSVLSPLVYVWDSRSASIGSHTFTARAYDLAGNQGTATLTLVIREPAQPAPTPSPTPTSAGPPTIAMTGPPADATVTGLVPITAETTGQGIERVAFFYDATNLIAVDSVPPYRVDLNTAGLTNGHHTLVANATWAGGVISSVPIPITVSNAAAPVPTPLEVTVGLKNGFATGQAVSVRVRPGTLPVTGVQFWVDGRQLRTDRAAPFAFTWDSRTVRNGRHTLTIIADAGLTKIQRYSNVRVANPLQVVIRQPANFSRIRGTVFINPAIYGGDRIKSVEFAELPPKVIGRRTASPFWLRWNTRSARNGFRTISVTVTDQAGKKSTGVIRVWVAN